MSQPVQQIRFCTSRDGVRIAYATCGVGPPLVWLGHWVRHLKFDWDSPVWRPWLSLLTRRHHVVRYDWRGCGLSDREGVEFSLDKHIEDLEAVVEASGPKRFVLIGDAGGGTVAMAYAARHQERVGHLVLYGCQTRGRLLRNDAKFIAEGQALLDVMELGWQTETPAYGEFFRTLHMPDATADQLRSYNELLHLTTSSANAVALLRAYFQADVLEAVTRIRCPTLILHARQDAIIPFDEGRLAASLIPGARLVPLESRNHILQEKEPAWQQLVSELEDFLPVGSADRIGLSLAELTARERDVLELVAQGLNNYRIADQLGISEKTVRNHVSVVFDKIGANSRAHAVALARDAGLGHGMINSIRQS
jgi:pimeloyl-ACP methyl ester carboxylesterase/DNA-binding CsgD family transcriptional regulator